MTRAKAAELPVRRGGWRIGALVVVVAAVVAGVVFAVGAGGDAQSSEAGVLPAQALASLFDDSVPPEEPVGAIGSEAIAALEGVRPVVQIADGASELLPRYVVASAAPRDGVVWDVQQDVQRRGTLELIVATGSDDDALLRVIRTSSAEESPAVSTEDSPATSDPQGDEAPTTAGPPTSPSTDIDGGPGPPTPGHTYVVRPGDNLWSIADAAVSAELDRPATDAEVTTTWVDLLEQNRPDLPDPGNPDLILPGMVLAVPVG